MSNQERFVVDSNIRARSVLLVDEKGEKRGVLPTSEALRIAHEAGMNLVQVTNNLPPVCKVLDYGKLKYDESKKQKAAAKKQRETRVDDKELIITPNTAPNDLKIKARKAIEFLNEGDRVKLTIKCSRREVTHPEVFKNTLNMFLDFIPGSVAVPTSSEKQLNFCYMITAK